MRIFKHGEALAIVFPDSIAKKNSLKEGDELEFFEAEPGVFIIASKKNVSELVKKTFYSKTSSLPDSKIASLPVKQESVLKKILSNKGFFVIENEFQGREASRELESEVASKSILSARGFDKKAYLVTRQFFELNSQKIMRALKEKDLSAQEICEATKLSADACAALICVLEDQGELLEKRKGLFQLVK